MYSALQLPSLLSLQFIFDSEGPSTVMPSPPIPAPLENVGKKSEVVLVVQATLFIATIIQYPTLNYAIELNLLPLLRYLSHRAFLNSIT